MEKKSTAGKNETEKKESKKKEEGKEEGGDEGEEGKEEEKDDSKGEKEKGGTVEMRQGDYMIHMYLEKIKEINVKDGETMDPMI